MKKILESNFGCIAVFFLIVFVFLLMWGIQQYQLFKLKQQLSVTYNYLQDIVDKMMQEETVSSFRDSKWRKFFIDAKSGKISKKNAINECRMLSQKYFDADAMCLGESVQIHTKQPNIKLVGAYFDATDDIVFKVDLNSSDAPNNELLDEYTFRVSDDGTLIPCDKLIATRFVKSLMYLPEQRKQDGSQ